MTALIEPEIDREVDVPTGPVALHFDGVGKTFRNRKGEGKLALEDVNLEVITDSFLCVLGASGCGKSTLLRIAAGLEPATAGEVTIGGRSVNGPPDGVVYVFQQYSKSIFPWLTVLQNVEFGLGSSGSPKAERRVLAGEMLEHVGLTTSADLYPWQISGGMAQRVAIARALVAKPSVLLMDEPFSALDAFTRASLQDLLLQIWAEMGLTIVFVTHDVDEAVYLGTRVVCLDGAPGRVIVDRPIDLPRPREQLVTRSLPLFGEVRGELLHRFHLSHTGETVAAA